MNRHFYLIVLMFCALNSFGQLNADFTCNYTSGCSPLSVTFYDQSSGNPTSWYWDFGNGNTSISRNPTMVFVNSGKYTVTLTVGNGLGSSTKTKKDYIVVYKNPAADFGINKQIGCLNEQMHFSDKSLAGSTYIKDYYWDFGDGGNANQKDPSHGFSNGGSYDVTLIVTDNYGCVSSITKTDFVEIKTITPNFYANKTFFCDTPSTAVFKNTTVSGSASITYFWTFGDGNSSAQENPSNDYQNTGMFTVKLKATDQWGCTDEITKKDYISIPNLIADFDIEINDTCQPAIVKFTNKSYPKSGLLYDWKFGDGGSSTSQSSTHTYSGFGTFVVDMTINTGVCSKKATNQVVVYPKPVIGFYADTLYHCKAPFTVQFTGTALGATSVKWKFGDGDSSILLNPAHTYSNYGNFTVSLTAVSNHGCTNKYIREAYIRSKIPEISLTADPQKGCKPLLVNYSVSDKSLVLLNTWSVNFGDGGINNLIKGKHTYNDSGIYHFIVTGWNSRGCKASDSAIVKVGIPPQTEFEYLHDSGCNLPPITFRNLTNTHKPVADFFEWEFGDGGKSNAENPTHKYQDTGYMTVKLTAGFRGCFKSFKRDTIIYILPVVAKLGTGVLCFPDKLQNANFSIGGHKWYWDFGDQSPPDTTINPVHLYQPGYYNLRFIVWDTVTGCVDSLTNSIKVATPPEDDFISDVKSGCKGQVINFSDTSTKLFSYFWKFGDFDSSSYKSPRITFIKGGRYTVSLQVTDENYCTQKIEKKFYITISQIDPMFSVSPNAGCIPLEVSLHDLSSSFLPLKTKLWSMGNGDNINTFMADTVYTYKKLSAGKDQNVDHPVSLYLADSLGCSESFTLYVNPTKPKSNIKVEKFDLCNQTAVAFSTSLHDTAVAKPASLIWKINDVFVSNSQNFTKKFVTDTNFIIKLVVSDKNGCSDSMAQTVSIVKNPPKASFTYKIYSTQNNCPPVVVSFTNTSQRGAAKIKRYFWNFGNNNYSGQVNPSNTYSEPGTYSVSLVVEDSLGCKDTFIVPDLVTINGAYGSFSVSPVKGCDSLISVFTPKVKRAIEYMWSFGDGRTSGDSFPTHKYSYPGAFKPVLVLKDSFGCQTSIVYPDSVKVFQSPVADFYPQSKMTCLGKETKFINVSFGRQKLVSYFWDLGNHRTSTNFEPSVLYNDTGRYDVFLKVTDSVGCNGSVLKLHIAQVYIDTIKPETPYFYRITHIFDPVLDELTFSGNDEFDFRNYSVFRADKANNRISERKLADDVLDTIIKDTLIFHPVPQCYYLNVRDYCDNISNQSKLHCLINLEVTPRSDGNFLDWTKYIGWNEVQRYEVLRKRKNTDTLYLHIANTSDSVTDFLDTNVYCGEKYEYVVKAYEKNGFVQTSLSNIDEGIGQKKMFIGPVELKRVSVEDEAVLIEWSDPGLDYYYRYSIFRSLDSVHTRLLAEVENTDSSFIDKDVLTAVQSYYYFIKINYPLCSVYGKPSNVGRTILLKVDKTSADEKMLLLWNPYIYWDEGVEHYEVDYKNRNTSEFIHAGQAEKDSTAFLHSINPFELNHIYRITATQKNNPEIISHSNIVNQPINPTVYIPNSFTPNTDGLNDVFMAKCYGCKVAKFQIFSRWGELLFETTDPDKGWDGTFKNGDCPGGVYYYQVFVKTENKTEPFFGTVTLLR